jgi:TRAP-type C4-dicarboxylate transport system permease small subunit
MKAFVEKYCKIADYGSFISMIGMITAITIQVIARLTLPSAPNWTEEMARIFFIYLVGFGVANGMKENAFVKLQILSNYLHERTQRFLRIFIYISIFFFSFTMIYFSYLFVEIGIYEKSGAMEISMGVVFFSIMIMMISLAVLSVGKAYTLIKGGIE